MNLQGLVASMSELSPVARGACEVWWHSWDRAYLGRARVPEFLSLSLCFFRNPMVFVGYSVSGFVFLVAVPACKTFTVQSAIWTQARTTSVRKGCLGYLYVVLAVCLSAVSIVHLMCAKRSCALLAGKPPDSWQRLALQSVVNVQSVTVRSILSVAQ
jgi:hypothetical protein